MHPSDPVDFERLDSVAQIGCLANEHRLAILGELVGAPMTGAQVARSLGLTAQLAHYHLSRLLEHGLVVEVSAGEASKGRSSERYFRSRARHLFVDPGLACRDDDTTSALVSSFEAILDAWQRREVLGVDLASVARRVVGDALAIGAGERVLIVSQPQVREIVEHIYIEVEARGGLPTLRPWSRDYALARVERFEEGALRSRPFAPLEELDGLAAVVFISSTQHAGPSPSARQSERLPHLLRALGEWMRALRTRGVRYLELSLPARGDLEHGDVDSSEALAIFWRSLQSAPEVLGAAVDALVATVSTGTTGAGSEAELLLTDARGSHLRVLVDAHQPHRNIGRIHREDALAGHLAEELPPGSVAWFPVDGSGDGQLLLPYSVVRGRRFRDVRVTLARGRITALEGEGIEGLREMLAAASGDADALAEVRIGVNPAGAGLTGKASLDAVLAGSITLAFGSNEVLGGTRRATLDLRFPSRSLSASTQGNTIVRDGNLADSLLSR